MLFTFLYKIQNCKVLSIKDKVMYLFLHYVQNISPGMKLWGVIAEVNEKDLVVSLPGGLRGLVRASDALDPVLDNEIEVLFLIRIYVHLYLFLFSGY